jgi:hypothetical protein
MEIHAPSAPGIGNGLGATIEVGNADTPVQGVSAQRRVKWTAVDLVDRVDSAVRPPGSIPVGEGGSEAAPLFGEKFAH